MRMLTYLPPLLPPIKGLNSCLKWSWSSALNLSLLPKVFERFAFFFSAWNFLACSSYFFCWASRIRCLSFSSVFTLSGPKQTKHYEIVSCRQCAFCAWTGTNFCKLLKLLHVLSFHAIDWFGAIRRHQRRRWISEEIHTPENNNPTKYECDFLAEIFVAIINLNAAHLYDSFYLLFDAGKPGETT